MGDSCCRKIPPDRGPEEELPTIQNKKSKLEEKEDVVMSEKMEDAEGCSDRSTREKEEDGKGQTMQSVSYKESLMGFKGRDYNGVAHNGSTMEEDPLLSDLLDQTWKIPEPSEEIKKLMSVYPVVPCSEEEFNEYCQPWNNTLIITVLGARFHPFKLKERLSKLWGFNDFELIDVPNNYYVVNFKDDESWGGKYKKVLFEGPWVVARHSILVQRWSPHFDPFHNLLGKIATWVRIPNIPLHCYSKNFIWRLGEMIGKTLKVDLHTLANIEDNRITVSRARFARICVEIDLQKKLVPRVICTSSLFNIEYEGLSLICFDCGRYGHRKEVCPWKASSSMDMTENPQSTGTVAGGKSTIEGILPKENDAHFGPWMYVRRQIRTRVVRTEQNRSDERDSSHRKMLQIRENQTPSGKRQVQKEEKQVRQSRYAALADVGEIFEEDQDLSSRCMAKMERNKEEKALALVEGKSEHSSRNVGKDTVDKGKTKVTEGLRLKTRGVVIGKEVRGPIKTNKAQMKTKDKKGENGPKEDIDSNKTIMGRKKQAERKHQVIKGCMEDLKA